MTVDEELSELRKKIKELMKENESLRRELAALKTSKGLAQWQTRRAQTKS